MACSRGRRKGCQRSGGGGGGADHPLARRARTRSAHLLPASLTAPRPAPRAGRSSGSRPSPPPYLGGSWDRLVPARERNATRPIWGSGVLTGDRLDGWPRLAVVPLSSARAPGVGQWRTRHGLLTRRDLCWAAAGRAFRANLVSDSCVVDILNRLRCALQPPPPGARRHRAAALIPTVASGSPSRAPRRVRAPSTGGAQDPPPAGPGGLRRGCSRDGPRRLSWKRSAGQGTNPLRRIFPERSGAPCPCPPARPPLASASARRHL